ncbi:hypothetical protein SISSUDRAFT_81198 [Sistotremastrum suecicum HHB10207 ss-3]|uniref:F-box domain-containing protein n=1 Tax=Sistotremastrum suecicum HHB10207 ss-3 TaxID=1314776 RepID=A0A166H596_9AGAM|nr:hypothetical protein SISSUDRAFT_81198 [Sistotremastrum suecicum HHB10207 ss-3]
MTGLDELVDTADSPHQGASACQDCGVYISQIQNTSLPLTIESNTDCSSDVINPIPMMPMIRTDIASLPTEILLHIFKLYYLHYSDAFPKGTVKDLQCWPILGVCSRWRQIVIGTPYFWQRLWTHWHPEIITLFEVRSKSYPLTIQRSSSGGFLLEFPSCDSEGNAVAARLIAAHSSRIRTLRLEWMDWYPETHETKYEFMRRCLADATFPELTQVLLRSVNHYMAMRSMKLNAPKLEVLTLRNLVLDSTSYPHLANLTHLTHIASDLTVQDIVSLLEACPQLESCDIRTRTLETPLLLPEQPHRVPLRALEYINISGLYWPSLARLLDRLEICQTANINLEIEPGERHDPHPLDVFRRIITPLISSYDSLEISGRGIKLIRSTERGSLNFEPDNSKYSVFAHFSCRQYISASVTQHC